MLAIHLQRKLDKRVTAGHPWVYSNEIAKMSDLKNTAPGSLAKFYNAAGDFLGIGFFNPKTLIAGRILTREASSLINRDFFQEKLQTALSLRDQFFTKPFYRLIHAEADGMPGLIIDRFGDIVVCEVNTAGMQELMPHWMAALQELIKPKIIYLKNDNNVRQLEGLNAEKSFYLGQTDEPIMVQENNLHFYADIIGGQKTGWFYDHRANRALIASLCKGGDVLDLYTYLGGFALAAAAGGAKSVVAVDRSAGSIGLAKKSASYNKLNNCQFVCEETFNYLEKNDQGKKFQMVIADPPAFAKAAKDIPAAKMGYRKLAHLSAERVGSGGFLFIASCSYHMDAADFSEQVYAGIHKAGRTGRLLRQCGADMDHPVHLHLPQTNYLKALLIQLD